MLPLSALLSSPQAQLTHSWPIIDSRTQSSHSLTHTQSLTQTLSHEWLLTSGKEQIRRKAKALLLLCSGLENISPQLASFASSRVLAATYCCCFLVVVLIVVVLVLGVFHWTIFVERRRTRKKIFPRRSACVFACDSTRYKNNNKTKRYINSSVRHFDNVFAQILLECEGGGTAHKVKIEGPDLARFFSSLLVSSMPKKVTARPNRKPNEALQTRLIWVWVCFVCLPLPVFFSLPPSLSMVFRLSCVSFSLYLRLSLCAVCLTCHAYFSPAQQWNRTLRRHFFGLPSVIHHLPRKGRGYLEGKLQPELASAQVEWVPSLTHFGSHR